MDLPLARIIGPTLGAYLGQTLTPEVAAKLASDILIQGYPGPVDLTGIEPKVVGSYVLECARAHEVLDELRPLHEAHWQETEGYRHGLPFAPDYERGLDLEQQGRYVLVVARHQETGKLVGNYGLYLSHSMHTQTLMATEDTLFLAREHRRGRLGMELHPLLSKKEYDMKIVTPAQHLFAGRAISQPSGRS